MNSSFDGASPARAVIAAMDSARIRRSLRLGFPELERVLKPTTGKYLVLAGRPGQHKTTLGFCWAANLASQGKTVRWVGLEQKAPQMSMMLLSRWSRVPMDEIEMHLNGQRVMPDERWAKVMATAQDLGQGIFFHDSTPALPGILESMNMVRTDAVFVDYIQLVSVPGIRQGEEYATVTAVSKALSDWAHKHNVLVVVLSQMNRSIEAEDRQPRLSDLRGSGQLEQDADAVVFLHRLKEDKTQVRATIEKNRYGPGGYFKLKAFPEIWSVVEEGEEGRDADEPSD